MAGVIRVNDVTEMLPGLDLHKLCCLHFCHSGPEFPASDSVPADPILQELLDQLGLCWPYEGNNMPSLKATSSAAAYSHEASRACPVPQICVHVMNYKWLCWPRRNRF